MCWNVKFNKRNPQSWKDHASAKHQIREILVGLGVLQAAFEMAAATEVSNVSDRIGGLLCTPPPSVFLSIAVLMYS